jgi:hypothetical protein
MTKTHGSGPKQSEGHGIISGIDRVGDELDCAVAHAKVSSTLVTAAGGPISFVPDVQAQFAVRTQDRREARVQVRDV